MMMLETLASGALILASTQGWCSPSHAPQISVQADFQPIEYNHRYSSALLERKQIDTVSPYGPDMKTKVGGLTEGSIRVSQQVTLAGARLGTRSCYWYDRIEVVIQVDPQVFIAKEYGRGSCRRGAVLEHEQKHVRVDQELVAQYRPAFIRAVQAAISEPAVYGPFPNEQSPSVQAGMSDRVTAAIRGVSAQMESDRAHLQQAVDSRAEYDRVAASCPNESP